MIFISADKHICYLSEPAQSVTKPKAKVLSSTRVQLEWDPIPETFRHGVIIKYTIVYRYENSTEIENRIHCPASAVRVIVNGLRQSADYSFWIFAATSKGNSPSSDVLMAKTEGKPKKGNTSYYYIHVSACLRGKMKRILFSDWLTKRQIGAIS